MFVVKPLPDIGKINAGTENGLFYIFLLFQLTYDPLMQKMKRKFNAPVANSFALLKAIAPPVVLALVSILFANGNAIATPTSDTTAPRLSELTIGNASVDASQGSVTQHITVRIIDDLSGVSDAGAYFVSNIYGYEHMFKATFGDYNRISGTAQDGIYDATLVVPQYAAQGTYDLNFFTNDLVGNRNSLSTGELAYLGLPTSMQVTSIGDMTAPTLRELTIGNRSVDASQGSVTQHIIARITDALSGISLAGVNLRSYINDVDRIFTAYFGDFNRISGTAQDGIYDTTLVVPQYAAQGTYDLTFFSNDVVGNSNSLSSGELAYLGAPTSMQVTSIGDTMAPILRELTLGSSFVDASQGSVTQHITARIIDDLSGISIAGAYFVSHINGGEYMFKAEFGDYNRISGTALDGIYDATLVIPQYAMQGRYDLTFSSSDHVGNVSSLSAGELGYLGVSPSLTIGTSATPEPATVGLLGIGLLGFALSRRKVAK